MNKFGSHISIDRYHRSRIKICNPDNRYVSTIQDSYEFDSTDEETRYIWSNNPDHNPIIPADEKPQDIFIDEVYFDAFTSPSGGSTCYHTEFQGVVQAKYEGETSPRELFNHIFEYDWDNTDGGGLEITLQIDAEIAVEGLEWVKISGFWLTCFYDYYLFDYKYRYTPD